MLRRTMRFGSRFGLIAAAVAVVLAPLAAKAED